MEISYKFILDKRRKTANERYPIKVRVYQNRQFKEFSLNIKVKSQHWNELQQEVVDSEPDYKLYNAKLALIKSKIQNGVLMAELGSIPDFTIADVIKIIKPSKKDDARERLQVAEFGKKLVTQLEQQGRIGNSIVYSCALSKLKSYCNDLPLYFEEIDYKFLEAFNTSLLSDGIKVNTISNYQRTLRAIFNRAIKEGLIDYKFYPFNRYKIKSERTINRALTVEEMKAIISVKFSPDSNMWHYQNLFLLSFCLIGVNFADLLTLKANNILDGRLVFHRKKTKKIYSIKLQREATIRLKPYVDMVLQKKDDFILPFVKNTDNPVKVKNDIGLVIHSTNENIKKIASMVGIKKDITTYYARYSWANIAKSLGYSKDMIAEALGHEYGNKVTGIYLDDYDNDLIDKMNEKVVNLVFDTLKS